MHRFSPTTLLALALCALTLVAAGCGGGEVAAGEVPGGPPALTVRSDSELGAGGSGADAADGADAESEDAASSATAEPTATAAPEGGTTAPDDAAAPEDAAAAEPEQPAAETAPDQFESFCEQNAGAC